eukprot:TRINITY_DN4983_c0_g1_i1.p1 TRINITY_DN4983_c0_g1~~TRINITY_DN4983_c0_g1_i1.p1  ORF type:complete len:297 (+),score=43.78 TRINITY_DN4983_c0_g1_i1:11-901(+)
MACSPDKAVLASSYVPKRVIRSFISEDCPLESNVSERLSGVVLWIQIKEKSKTPVTTLNKTYLEPLISTCESFGGDIIQLACDSLLVLWQWDDQTANTELRTVALCALKIQKLSDSAGGSSLRMSISADKNIFFSTLGGFEGRWRFLLSGGGIKQAGFSLQENVPDWSIVVAPETWTLMEESCQGNQLKSGYFLLTGVKRATSTPRDIMALFESCFKEIRDSKRIRITSFDLRSNSHSKHNRRIAITIMVIPRSIHRSIRHSRIRKPLQYAIGMEFGISNPTCIHRIPNRIEPLQR